MCARRDGRYTQFRQHDDNGLKRVDVDELYDKDQYQPKVRRVLGKPMFLY